MQDSETISISEKYEPVYTTDKRYTFITGGRGSGKSFFISLFAEQLSYEKGHKILYTRYTLSSAEKSIIPEFKERIDQLGVHSDFKILRDRIINLKSKSEIIFLGIKGTSGNQTARLKSIQGITTWIYDEFEEHPDERSFDTIDLSIRTKDKQNRIIMLSNALHKQSWQYQRFLEPIYKHGMDEYGTPKVIAYKNFPGRTEILNDHHTLVVHTTYYDNYYNLSQSFLDQAERAKKTLKYERDFLGIHYDITEGALWTHEMFIRREDHPPLSKIVVAIDPAVSQEEDSDLTGIIVAGRGTDDKFYVLGDYSGNYSPQRWGRLAVDLYHQFQANEIVAESNNGGDLVEGNLRFFDRNVPIKQVKASRGKFIRAEPIARLYEEEKVYHTGNLYKLEQELTTWSPELSKKSPDRLDALVWALTRLSSRQKVFVI